MSLHGKKGVGKKDKKRVTLWQDVGTLKKNWTLLVHIGGGSIMFDTSQKTHSLKCNFFQKVKEK